VTRVRRISFFVLAAALTSAALVAAAPLGAQAAAPDSVTLRFAWPVGTEARIRYTQLTERQGDRDQPSRLEIEGELTMHVHEHAQGLLIEHLDPLVTRFQATPPLAADDPHRAVYAGIGVPTPHYVVSRDGTLVGVDGAGQLTATIATLLGPEALRSGALDAIGRELLNETMLAGLARERWNALVGLWLDTSLKMGEPTGAESQESNPMVPSVVLPYAYRFELVGMEPCDEARPEGPKCARVGMLSLPDPVEFNRVMNKAMADMGLPNMSFDGLAQHTQVELLTDPVTLLPRELTLSKVVEGILKEGDQSRVFRRVDGLVLVFTYAGS
jgi:hypothetical protein